MGNAACPWQAGAVSENRQVAPRANMTTPENPWPLRLLTQNIREYVDKISDLWVEGQVVQYTPRGATRMAFFTLRDVDQDVSMTVTAYAGVLAKTGEGFDEGARIVARVKPAFYEPRGTLSLRAADVRLQGLGSLLAQIERLRAKLEAEGLFHRSRLKPLPFAPLVVGLVCGKNAKAKDDVIVNARLRWPNVRFVVREVLVQGIHAVTQVTAAIESLDAHPEVEVIVVARGGGSVEDLLPFSDETLVRAAAAAQTPLVSAIGHEGDTPLLDLVADYRASTPTDAARRIVPDYREELQQVASLRGAATAAMQQILARQRELLGLITSRPVLMSPTVAIDTQRAGLSQAALRMDAALGRSLSVETSQLASLTAGLKALSPESTLERGYSILRTPAGLVIRDAATLKTGDLFEALLAKGTFVGTVAGTNPNGRPLTDSEDSTDFD